MPLGQAELKLSECVHAIVAATASYNTCTRISIGEGWLMFLLRQDRGLYPDLLTAIDKRVRSTNR